MKDKWIKAPQSIIDFLYKRVVKARKELVIVDIIIIVFTLGGSLYFIYPMIKSIYNNVNSSKLIIFSICALVPILFNALMIKMAIKEYKVLRSTTKEMKEGKCYIGKTNIVKNDSTNHTRYVIIEILDEDGNMLKEERYKLVDNYNESRAGDEIIIFKAKCWEKELIVLKDSEINRLQYKLDKIF